MQPSGSLTLLLYYPVMPTIEKLNMFDLLKLC
jgi:hypothetical protein